MPKESQYNLQIIINQLFELDYNHDDIAVILRKALTIILKSPISTNFMNKGVVMLADNNTQTLKIIAQKNLAKETLHGCKNLLFGACICGKAASTKKIQYVNRIEGVHKLKSHTEEHGHYSLPIMHQNQLMGVLTLYLLPTHKKNEQEIQTLTTITNTLALIIHKNIDVKYANFIKNKLVKSFGQEYFRLLAKFLSKDFGMKYCLIGQYDEKNKKVQTIVFTNGQQVQANFSYSIKGTPCNVTIESASCFYPDNVQQLFPEDKDLITLGVKSYFGILLKNGKNKNVGLVAFMHDKPINNVRLHNEKLEFFIPRLVSECERFKLENELNNEVFKFKNIMQSLNDVYVRMEYNEDGVPKVKEVSSSIYKLIGVKAKNIIGKDAVFNITKQRRLQFFSELLKNKEVVDFQLTSLDYKSETLHLLINSKLVVDDNNKPKEIISFVKDVTHKKNEEIRKDISYLIAKKSQRRITNISSLTEYIYHILSNIMDVSNFCIAFHNNETNTIDFPVHVDQKHKIEVFNTSRPVKNGLVEALMKHKRYVYKTKDEFAQFIAQNKIDFKATLPKIMISFPLKSEGIVVGVLKVKSYKNEHAFSANDIALLEFTATQLSNIIERDQWQRSLMQKEKYFRALVESSLEVTGIVDDNGKINYISESVQKILGYPAHYSNNTSQLCCGVGLVM